MNDQAEQLRLRLNNHHTEGISKTAKTIAIASGKGGVGKSNFTINFALKLIENNKKVLIFDLDIGMGNIDILLGVSQKQSIVNLLNENLVIDDIIELGPNSLHYIAGGSGLTDIFDLDIQKFDHFQSQFNHLVAVYDYILFDMGAGVTKDSLNFITAADEAFVVTTPEPTSITDAYAMIKHLDKRERQLPLSVLVNRALHDRAGHDSFSRLKSVVERFLAKHVSMLGVIPDDRAVLKSVTNQVPFVIDSPKCPASKATDRIVRQFLADRKDINEIPTLSFMSKLKRLVLER